MRKEILIAIIAGVIFGLIVAFGIWRANSALKTNTSEATTSKKSEEQKGPESQELRITLASPQENDVVFENPVKISGITKAGSWLVISSENEDYVLKASESGEFEQEVELSAGVNQILISARDATQSISKKDLILVYSTEFAKHVSDQ